MNLGLKGKVAIVTGGTRGIGRVIAHTIAREGVRVVIAGTNQQSGYEVINEIEEMGGRLKRLNMCVKKVFRDAPVRGVAE